MTSRLEGGDDRNRNRAIASPIKKVEKKIEPVDLEYSVIIAKELSN